MLLRKYLLQAAGEKDNFIQPRTRILDEPMETCYSIKELMRMMANRIEGITATLSDDDAISLISEIRQAKRIYLAGAGRSGLIAKAFGMRLMHLGYESYIVGETITPSMKREDLLVVFSGSGETKSIAEIAEIAHRIGGRVALITANRSSGMGNGADCVVELDTRQETASEAETHFDVRQLTGEYRSLSQSIAPLGTLFESASLIFADAIISALMEIGHCDVSELRDRLANIQ